MGDFSLSPVIEKKQYLKFDWGKKKWLFYAGIPF
jgi:hypothetical protein